MSWWLRLLLLRRLWLAGAVVLGAALAALAVYSWVELARFERVEARRTAFVYAAPQTLAPGVHVRLADLAGTLARLHYMETRASPRAPGQFRLTASRWELSLRGLPGLVEFERRGPSGKRHPQRVADEVSNVMIGLFTGRKLRK